MTLPSSNFTAEDVKKLRERSGAGMLECKVALEKWDGDILMAEGWLLCYGRAIHTPTMTHEEYAERGARAFKEKHKDQ